MPFAEGSLNQHRNNTASKMPPSRPTVLDNSKSNAVPIGWDGAKFPLSKLDLSKLARDYGKKGRSFAKDSIISTKTSARGRLSQIPASSRVVARRKKGIISPRSSGGNSPRISPRVSAGNVRLVSRTDNGWSWLSVKFKEIRANKFVKPRKGELPPELIKAIWGSHNLRHCQLSGNSLKGFGKKKISLDTESEIKKVRVVILKFKLHSPVSYF
ncbi:hypothetical protein L7F22_059446 [Adiantum nelumboides]|nr:hypothetical protein [Adiantum nelumboides]